MNNYGLVISKPGFDADKCEPEDTVFDTRFDTLKAPVLDDVETVKVLNFVFTTTPPRGRTRVKTIKHNFGYKPLYLSYLDYGGSTGATIVPFGAVSGRYELAPVFSVNDSAYLEIRTNETEIYFDFVRNAAIIGSGGLNLVGTIAVVKYYIFANDSAIA